MWSSSDWDASMKALKWLIGIAVVVIFGLGVLFAMLFLGAARAEGADLLIRSSADLLPNPPVIDAVPSANIVSERGAAWFALVALVAVIGVPFTRKAVDFILERPWAKWIKNDWRILLAFVFALGWTLFMFQDGILNIAALALLPMWQSVLVVAGMITLAAAGTVDGDARAQKKALKLADQTYADGQFGDGEPRVGQAKDYA
jgi:hypothetical protein